MSTTNTQSENIANAFFEHAAAFMVVIGQDGSIVNHNPSFANWINKDVDNVSFPSEVVSDFAKELDKNANHFHSFDKDDRITSWKVVKNDGDLIYIIGADITARVHREQNLKFAANTDVLTKMLNRRGFLAALDSATNSNDKHSLIVFDLDGFKRVNDTMGHCAGDEILCEVAKRVKDCSRSGDLSARLGGDEFAILIHNNHENTILVERLLAKLTEPYLCQGVTIDYISASIGKLDFDSSHTKELQPSTLLCISDELMYQSKKQGKSRWSQRTLVL